MLTPQQVIGFLKHQDAEVRRHAAEYLSHMGKGSPGTGDDFWSMIDRYGFEQTRDQLHFMQHVPQTDASVGRLVEVLRSRDPAVTHAPEDRRSVRSYLRDVALHVDFPLLERHREALLEVTDGSVRRHLEERLALVGVDREELWRRLAEFAQHADEKQLAGSQFDQRLVDRLVEALARHGEWAVGQAMTALERGKSWLEVFAAQLLGAMRYRPAIDALAKRLSWEGEALVEESWQALALMQDPASVPKVEAWYWTDWENYHSSVAETLGRLKLPESEAALLRLVERETDDEAMTFLLMALMELCTTEGMPKILPIIEAERYDPAIVDLKEEMIPVAKMAGFDLPQAAQWEAEKDRRQEAAWRKSFPQFAAMQERLTREPRVVSEEELSVPAPGLPFRRDEPKVGRNDPCPCGSGKKYKKCCGK